MTITLTARLTLLLDGDNDTIALILPHLVGYLEDQAAVDFQATIMAAAPAGPDAGAADSPELLTAKQQLRAARLAQAWRLTVAVDQGNPDAGPAELPDEPLSWPE